MRCVEFHYEAEYIDAFVEFPKQLYFAYNNMENPEEIRKMLLGTHVLSKYFTLNPFLIYKEDEVVGRFAITTYSEDETAYFGFFECMNDDKVANFLFAQAKAYAKQKGYSKMVGPLDGSFWNKYRLKTNHFDRPPYTGEPYNLPYYLSLFEKNGFVVCKRYHSNLYGEVPATEESIDERLARMEKLGYEIVSPKVKDFDRVIGEVYEMIMQLYRDFPMFKELTREDFETIFSDYRYILNMKMVKMAYYKGKPVGFFINVPDYGNLVYHLEKPGDYGKLFMRKMKPKQLVMLYMGVVPKHYGLGKAFVGTLLGTLNKKKIPCAGALVMEGKATGKYGEEYITSEYEYVLLEANL